MQAPIRQRLRVEVAPCTIGLVACQGIGDRTDTWRKLYDRLHNSLFLVQLRMVKKVTVADTAAGYTQVVVMSNAWSAT